MQPDTIRLPDVSLNLSTKVVTVTSTFTTIDLGFASIRGFTLTYGRTAGSTRSRLKVKLEGQVLGQPIAEWDPINEAAPKVPGAGSSVFDLTYLGLDSTFPSTRPR